MKTAHVLLFVILATACGTIPVSDPGPTEPAATQLPEHDAPDEPISISQTLRCGPQAVPYDLSQAPQLPTDLALESLCEDARPVIDGVEESQPRQVVRWNEDERFLEITDGGLGLVGMEVEFTLAQDGSVVEIHSFGASGFYVSSYGSTRYRLNEDEELDWKFAASRPSIDTPEDEWIVLVKEQT
jgi:hypothetical protein